MAQKFDTVDAYVEAQPPANRQILNEVRSRVRTIAPDAIEAISYQIPAFKVGGKPVVYVAGWTSHVALYPIPECDEQLAGEIARYVSGKGTLRFPLDEPFPYELAERVIKAAIAQRAPVPR
jgi:uncharacterized protein YdhG (YjbR/CyaY superfamily)